MAGVVMAAPRRLAGAHRQHRLTAVERLDLRLFVDAQDDGLGRRGEVETNHIAYLGHEVSVRWRA